MHPQVRHEQRLEALHGPLRLFPGDRADQRADLLLARRPQPVRGDTRPHPWARSRARGTARRGHVRLALERSRRSDRMGRESEVRERPASSSDACISLTSRILPSSQGRGIHLRAGYERAVQPHQRAEAHRAGAPACHGRLQLVPRHERRYDILSAQLLLSLWEPGSHHGRGRAHGEEVPPVRSGAPKGRAACGQENARILLVKRRPQYASRLASISRVFSFCEASSRAPRTLLPASLAVGFGAMAETAQ
eukprot:scaffold1867_cov247-Pinguiococcus_pyrenoidosus.AAC.4